MGIYPKKTNARFWLVEGEFRFVQVLLSDAWSLPAPPSSFGPNVPDWFR